MAWTTPITWVTGGVTAAQFNTHIRDNPNWLKAALSQLNVTSDSAKAKITPALVGARVYKAAAQTITTGSGTLLTFDTERFDSDAFHDNSTNPQRFTIPSGMGGYYLIGAHIRWQGNATGYREMLLRLNATTYIAAQSARPNTTEAVLLSCVTLFELATGDDVEVLVQQTSGGNLDITASADDSPNFWIHRISSS